MDLKSVQAELAQLQAKGAALATKSPEELSDREVTELERMTDRILELKAQERGLKNAETIAQIADLGGGVELDADGGRLGFSGSGAKSGYLDLSPRGIKSFARTMATQATSGSKALLTGGSIATQVPLQPNVVRLGGGGLALLSALPTIQHDTPSWKFLKQTVRQNLAAKVAPGAEKPVSIVSAEEVDGALDVFATLSEPVGKYVLRDQPALERFLAAELVYMVGSAVQAAAVAAFLAEPGIQSVTAASEPIVSVRKGVQAVEDLGFEADLIVLNSADYFDIVTTRNAGGTFDVSGGVGASEEAPRLWGKQVVSVTSGVPVGSALVLDRSAVAIDTDTVGMETEFNPYSGFSTNTVTARTEMRAGVSVFQPSALALVDLAAA